MTSFIDIKYIGLLSSSLPQFKKKKEVQIQKLEEEINKIMESMTQQEIDNFNLYMVRTHDQANKQIEAIKLAKENLDNSKKIKVNLS